MTMVIPWEDKIDFSSPVTTKPKGEGIFHLPIRRKLPYSGSLLYSLIQCENFESHCVSGNFLSV